MVSWQGGSTLRYRNGKGDLLSLGPPLAKVCPAFPACAFAALTGYLGEDKEQWRQYDATLLAESYSGPSSLPILMDTGALECVAASSDANIMIPLREWLMQSTTMSGLAWGLFVHVGVR